MPISRAASAAEARRHGWCRKRNEDIGRSLAFSSQARLSRGPAADVTQEHLVLACVDMSKYSLKRIPMQIPHRRQNLLTGDWVLVSPQRAARPWLGAQEPPEPEALPPYEPTCSLCPGNRRASGIENPRYGASWTFDNDFPALLETGGGLAGSEGMFREEAVSGQCRVMCFSPRHDLALADLSVTEMRGVIDRWADEVATLGRRYSWVQVFENRGAAMGCSNPHPHGQIWALDALPTEALKEHAAQLAWRSARESSLLLDVAAAERATGTRVVLEEREWLVIVPHWALWPFETLLIPRRHARHLHALDGAQRESLARVLQRLLRRYDNLFGAPFPYTMGWHGAPFGVEPVDGWQLHAHVFPPLLRSATVRKFMVGFEMLAEGQRDLTPEEAAARLREASEARPLHPRLRSSSVTTAEEASCAVTPQA
jgi:UDPglucose--hexose-1-phosphate uridylyltransferase